MSECSVCSGLAMLSNGCSVSWSQPSRGDADGWRLLGWGLGAQLGCADGAGCWGPRLIALIGPGFAALVAAAPPGTVHGFPRFPFCDPTSSMLNSVQMSCCMECSF